MGRGHIYVPGQGMTDTPEVDPATGEQKKNQS